VLRRLRSRLTYANVMSTIAVFGVLAGGSAYAANTIGSTDIIDGQVNSADVKDQSLTTFDVSTFLGADIVDGTITGADLASNSITRDQVSNNTLIDRDVGETVLRDFAGDIGTVSASSCVNKAVTGGPLSFDHILLTPSFRDANGALEYTAKYDPTANVAYIHVCNWSNATIDDGTTHFNLLAFNGFSSG
jgi:hypothetical protein